MLWRLRKVNPLVLLGSVIAIVLSFGVIASAEFVGGPITGEVETPIGQQPPLGGTAGDALRVGEAQMGKPFVMSTDGPNTFSCSGLMRYIMRTTGVDADAPWVPEGYLGKYAPVDPVNIQPGDIVIYPNWATMYAGDGMLLNANEWKGYVTHTPMEFAGVPVGIARPPYSGQPQGEAIQPLDDVIDPLAAAPLEEVVDPLAAAPLDEVVDPLAAPLDETLVPLDETLVQQPLDEVIQPPLDEAPLLY